MTVKETGQMLYYLINVIAHLLSIDIGTLVMRSIIVVVLRIEVVKRSVVICLYVLVDPCCSVKGYLMKRRNSFACNLQNHRCQYVVGGWDCDCRLDGGTVIVWMVGTVCVVVDGDCGCRRWFGLLRDLELKLDADLGCTPIKFHQKCKV